MQDVMVSRRLMLGGALSLGGASLIGAPALGAMPERRLAFRNVHNNERVDARYFGPNGFDRQGLAEINHGMRDWRSGEVADIDRGLIELLTAIRDRLGVAPQKHLDIISGYRSPNTNAKLRAQGGAHTGVATKSLHMLGKATDIAVPGVPLAKVKLAAAFNQRGGVGYYPKDGFVHVDTGRVRSW